MTQDLRVQKTQAAIHQAFWTLLANRPLTKIAVADLINEAQIGKATFYHHYVDKFDLARKLCDLTQAPLIALCTQRINSHHLQTLFLPLPEGILQDATHLRLLDTVQTPEFNGQTQMIQALHTSFQQALTTHDPNFPNQTTVTMELATLYQHVVIVDLIGNGQPTMAAQMQAIQQAVALLFPKL